MVHTVLYTDKLAETELKKLAHRSLCVQENQDSYLGLFFYLLKEMW